MPEAVAWRWLGRLAAVAAILLLPRCAPVGGSTGAQFNGNPYQDRPLDDLGYDSPTSGYNQILNVPPYGGD